MKKIIISFLASIMILASCKEIELEKVDPNNFKDATPDLLIKAPMLAQALVIEGELARLANIFTDQFTGADRQYISYESYNVIAGDFDNIWATTYADGIGQCRIIEEKAIADNNELLEGIALIVEANLLGNAAAVWGDVPNVQAGNVALYPEPVFDGQVSVYTSAIAKLNSAIAKVGDNTVSDADYASATVDASVRETMTWAQVAYSIQARLYLHLGQYAEAIAAANNGIPDGSGDWLINHNDNDGWVDGIMNIYWNFMQWNRYGYLGAQDAYLPQLMTTRSDPRYDYYYVADDPWPINPYAWYGGIFQNDHSFPVITYYETQLIIAECELIDGTPDPTAALAALNNVRAYWDTYLDGMWGADDYFLPYVAADFASNADLLEEILVEKYTSCYGQLEAFNDMRRTDNYIGIPIKAGTAYPERFLIPQTELDANDNATAVDLFTPTSVNTGTYVGVK
jgi:starch-binding outer membrane protein, SusD/RagB family